LSESDHSLVIYD